MYNSGICDNNKDNITILATRVFDNVRIELNRTVLTVDTSIVQSDITALYASGTGTSESNLVITPHLNMNCADICGELSLESTLTYIYSGARQSAKANLKVPINLRMNIPEDSVWPYNVTVHYSFFSDNLKEEDVNTYSSLTDGVIIIYITALTPINVNSNCPMVYNFAKDRAIQNENAIATSIFYPTI